MQAMRKRAVGKLDGAIVGIGNAPTALIELIRLIREEGVRPALVVGMPVGRFRLRRRIERSER